MAFVIVSAETADSSPHENLGNSIELRGWLMEKYGNATPAHGHYQGRGEEVFVVSDVSRFDAWDIWQYAHEEFGQESVLFVDSDLDNRAYLFFDRPGDDGGRDDEVLGTWTELGDYPFIVPSPPRGDWTLIGGTYFQVRK